MLIDELHQLTKEFKQQSRPLFEARFASGQYEVLRADARLEPADKPEEELSQVRIEPAAAGGRVMKAVLSQQEFPELYDMKQRINWLMKHLHASGG